jgi:hypothetical protein
MSQLMDGVVKELNEKIGDRAFFTLAELVSIGLFGTVQTARNALKDGEIPFIRMSERRCVIPRAALLEYLSNNLAANEKTKKLISE